MLGRKPPALLRGARVQEVIPIEREGKPSVATDEADDLARAVVQELGPKDDGERVDHLPCQTVPCKTPSQPKHKTRAGLFWTRHTKYRDHRTPYTTAPF